MGNSLSSKSKAIDKQLKVEQKRVSKEIKILLLGTVILYLKEKLKRLLTFIVLPYCRCRRFSKYTTIGFFITLNHYTDLHFFKLKRENQLSSSK